MADWTSSVLSYLRETLLTVGSLPVVAYEGREFTPTVGVRWLREQYLPVDAPVVSLGPSGFVREDFIYRLTLYSPLKASPSADGRLTTHNDLVDTIRAKFYPGSLIRDTDSTIFGSVYRCVRNANQTEPDWISAAISVYAYYHRATRAA